MSAQNIHLVDDTQNSDQKEQQISQLYNAVKHSIRRYLYELEGTEPSDMYDMVLRQIEQPLLEAVLEHTRGNQSRAAEYLGMNRGTLRKKLRAYNINQ